MLLRVTLLALLFVAPLPTVQAEQMPDSSKEEQFWKWFENNESDLYNFEQDPGQIFAPLVEALQQVNDYLSFQVGPADNDGRREFVLSVDGYLEAFPAVEALHAAGPFSHVGRLSSFANVERRIAGPLCWSPTVVNKEPLK